jgi:homospermidine synthase
MKFDGRILVLGCGYVARCTIPLMLKHLDMPAEKINVLDMLDNRKYIKAALDKGVKYTVTTVTKENLDQVLGKYVSKGDLIIDLSTNIGCIDLLDWCHNSDVLYINTSVEEWDPFIIKEFENPTTRTLYERQMDIRKLVNSRTDEKGPTAVLDHGANPGLVSHFTKLGLKAIARKIIQEKPEDRRVNSLNEALEDRDYARLAQLSGVKVIHISERDTQITDVPKKVNEFVNTWSIMGLYEEGIAPAELGWGTHERRLPPNAQFHSYGPGNQICLAQMGIKTWVRSWVPQGEITGMVIRHGEAFSISDYLTVWEGGKPVYRPTVNYAYCPCDAAVNSLHELEMRQFRLQEDLRIMTDEIIDGKDELGVLLMGHDFKSWWVGSMLDIHEARELVPHQNATTLQVACSVMGATLWMLRNPREGVCLPDDLPHEEVLSFAREYLGPMFEGEVDWDPLMNRVDLYKGFDSYKPTEEDTWQFQSFLV